MEQAQVRLTQKFSAQLLKLSVSELEEGLSCVVAPYSSPGFLEFSPISCSGVFKRIQSHSDLASPNQAATSSSHTLCLSRLRGREPSLSPSQGSMWSGGEGPRRFGMRPRQTQEYLSNPRFWGQVT